MPSSAGNLGWVKRYHLRTYGCQMNEHDSERIAGLLESDGYAATDSADDADVIVLNTCCIRENADNKLYGALGNLKQLRSPTPIYKSLLAGVWPKRIVTRFSSGPATSTLCSVPTTYIGRLSFSIRPESTGRSPRFGKRR